MATNSKQRRGACGYGAPCAAARAFSGGPPGMSAVEQVLEAALLGVGVEDAGDHARVVVLRVDVGG